jgi:acyl transferase domain-containing protein/phosphopantetheinyl transferase
MSIARTAIIGMACVFPGARDMQRYWENILTGVDCITDPPADWEADFFYDPDSDANDRTYCKRGGYLGALASFDPVPYGIMPNAVDGTEPDHFLSLRAASDALTDAGYRDAGRFRERTEVIIGRGTYVNRGNANALQHAVMVDSFLRALRQLHPEHSEEELAAIKDQLKAGLPPFDADTAAGLVPNIISGRICNRLDLMGSNYIIDAACASSLVAVDLAVRDLATGRCDMAIAGGVNASVPPVIMIIFSQLKALSKKGMIRPFDSDADGTLLAEGVGMVVLKRLEDAERDGDRIYAVIRGIGTASDGRALGLLAPRFEGEELALRRAYEAAGVDPRTVGMIEAHGTATTVGDAVEVQALTAVFGGREGRLPRCALGSVKSMIGHTMPASGAAGLIKTALALHHKVLPQTLLAGEVNPQLHLESSNFYVNTEARPWIHGSSASPRRAGVNAFGFGGINAHAVLEEYTGTNAPESMQRTWDSELFVVSAATDQGLVAEVEETLRFVSSVPTETELKDLAWTINCTRPQGATRIAVVATSCEDLVTKLQRAGERLKASPTRSIREKEGIYWFREPLAKRGKLAFVFPGEGAQYVSMLHDICVHFPEAREWFDLMDQAFEGHSRGYLLSEAIFPPPGASTGKLWSMDIGAEAVFCANQAMWSLIDKLGIQPDAMLGQSTGEHSSLLASGAVVAKTREELIRYVLGINKVFTDLSGTKPIREGILMTVAGVGMAELASLLERHEGELFIALDNCPNQVVIFGAEARIQAVKDALTGTAAICQQLPFGRAYHTPWFEQFARLLESHFHSIPTAEPNVALYSCVTAGLYPQDAAGVRHLAARQWATKVRFRETIEAMYRDGVRIFLEVGPRQNLSGFINDTLRGKPILAVPSNVHHRSGILQLNHMVAQLSAHGVRVNVEHLFARRAPREVTAARKLSARLRMTLAMGLQPMRLPADFTPAKSATAQSIVTSAVSPAAASPLHAPPVESLRSSIMTQHLQAMDQFVAAQHQVMAAYLGRCLPAPNSAARREPAVLPFLTELVEHVPGTKARARHNFSLQRERLFTDHTLGRNVSTEDPSLTALPVVPITVTMEILAEGGALLAPGKVLAGMRDVRASRWITLDEDCPSIEIEANRIEENAVHVKIREAGEGIMRQDLAEGTMFYADNYPTAPAPASFRLELEHISAWTSERLYTEGMFHGSSFQAVRSVERSGSNGITATIETQPRHDLIAGMAQPTFLTDPVVLDAAGQVVAFWSQEELQPCGDIFPYRLNALHCFAPPQPPGMRLECRVFALEVNPATIRSDIELVDSSGRLQYRFEGWEDRRFHVPVGLWQLRISPQKAFLSEPWEIPRSLVSNSRDLACCRIAGMSEVLDSSLGIWTNVLAHIILSRRERQEWRAMQATHVLPKRRQDWLLGRCVAKDAVRLLIRERFQADLCPADVEIVPDTNGRPEVRGAWTGKLGSPTVSLSHCGGTAIALASLDPTSLVGVDMESLSRSENFEHLAFADQERQVVASLNADQHPEWFLRLWCAREAVSKALGQGFGQGMDALLATGVSTDTGLVEVRVKHGLLQQFPELSGKTFDAHTARHENFIYSMVYQQR